MACNRGEDKCIPEVDLSNKVLDSINLNPSEVLQEVKVPHGWSDDQLEVRIRPTDLNQNLNITNLSLNLDHIHPNLTKEKVQCREDLDQ